MDLRVRPLSNLRGLSMPYRRAAICSDFIRELGQLDTL